MSADRELPLATRIRNRLFHLWFLLIRPMTLGVRAIVYDKNADLILLVRHTYVPGWHIPGGGVDAGETAEQAVLRELREETNIVVDGEPELISFHFNRGASRRDHIVLYRLDEFHQAGEKQPDREIAEVRFFPLDHLPDDISPGTLRRIEEVFRGRRPDSYW